MKPVAFDHQQPDTLSAALDLLTGDHAKVIAGGQSLGPMMNLRLARPKTLVGLPDPGTLRKVRRDGDRLLIGAAVTHARIEDGDTDGCAVPDMLRAVAANIAYRAVRNRGTVGGSLAHADPAADWVSAMTALDARLHLVGPGERRRSMAMTGFMQGAYRTALAPGEIIEAVELPADLDGALWGYEKVCRKVGEFADAIGAVVVVPQRRYIRVLIGACEGAPVLLDELAGEIARSARRPDPSRVRAAVAARMPNADRVKHHLLTTALCRAIDRVLPA